VNGLPFLPFLTPSGGEAYPVWFLPLQLLMIAAIFWFLLLRPQRQQQQRQKEMLAGIKKGDEVITAGGIIGKVVHVKDNRVTIQSAESRLVIERERITTIVAPEAAEEPAQK
jgi:preprotein translocase subunit YajC